MDPGRSARAAEPSAQRSLGRNANNRGSTAKDQAGSVTRFRRKDCGGPPYRRKKARLYGKPPRSLRRKARL